MRAQRATRQIRQGPPVLRTFAGLRHTINGGERRSGKIQMIVKPKTGILSIFFFIGLLAFSCIPARAQAALLMEEPYGFYGTLNPTGHNAVYFENICAETPVKLRRCQPGELGAVISRYEGVDGYDWVAIPLIPYLYAVENASQVPDHVTHDLVDEMRNRYREVHLHPLGLDQSGDSFVVDGWRQLIGAAYERRIYAFRFETTRAQDDAFIAWINSRPNHSHFNMLFRNCADFARQVLNRYFPHTFHRSIFPDAGVTTPKQIAFKLVRYTRKHPELRLTVFDIPQIPGYRWRSHSNKNIAESFSTTIYAVPLTLANPYLAGGIFVDYLIRGRYHLLPKNPQVIGPDNMAALTAQPPRLDNPAGAVAQATGALPGDPPPAQQSASGKDSGLIESQAAHEQIRPAKSR